ncbi:hypothetical protein D9M72_577680 [compost metagenome]
MDRVLLGAQIRLALSTKYLLKCFYRTVLSRRARRSRRNKIEFAPHIDPAHRGIQSVPELDRILDVSCRLFTKPTVTQERKSAAHRHEIRYRCARLGQEHLSADCRSLAMGDHGDIVRGRPTLSLDLIESFHNALAHGGCL